MKFEPGTLQWESSFLMTKIIGKTYLKCKCPVFANIKQTLQVRNKHLFFMHSFPYFRWIKFCSGCFRQVFFSFGGQKEWSLVALDRWSFYTVTIVWELAWADSALVVLGDWSSYKGGRRSRFDCSYFINRFNWLSGINKSAWMILHQKTMFSKALYYEDLSNNSLHLILNPASVYLFKVNNRSTRKRCEICSKLTIKTPERCQWWNCSVMEAWDYYRDGYTKVGVRSFLGSKPTKNNIEGIWLLVFFANLHFFLNFTYPFLIFLMILFKSHWQCQFVMT